MTEDEPFEIWTLHYRNFPLFWIFFIQPLETIGLLKLLNPVVPKVWVATQTRVAKGRKWVSPRQSEPGLHIFTVTTACLCLSVGYVLDKTGDCWYKNEVSNLLLKIIHTTIIFFLCCLRHGSWGVQQIQIRVVVKSLWTSVLNQSVTTNRLLRQLILSSAKNSNYCCVGKSQRHVRKASHRGSKRQQRSCVAISLILSTLLFAISLLSYYCLLAPRTYFCSSRRNLSTLLLLLARATNIYTISLFSYYCLLAPRIYIFVLRAHPVRGESHNQHNTPGDVATLPRMSEIWKKIELTVVIYPKCFHGVLTFIKIDGPTCLLSKNICCSKDSTY